MLTLAHFSNIYPEYIILHAGQEFKVVILTTVMRRIDCLRTPGENFGFLSDYRLLNVAMSRAKSLVIVVGDAVTLCSIGKCKKDLSTTVAGSWNPHWGPRPIQWQL